jgi:site-specific recombinase XerD
VLLIGVDGSTFVASSAVSVACDRSSSVGQMLQEHRVAGLVAGSLHLHWLRHSFASSLISSGCSVKAVADAMGHGDPWVTLRLYASLWPGDDDRIRQAIEQAWTDTIADSLRTAAGQS